MTFFSNTLISKKELIKRLQIILMSFGFLCLFSIFILSSKDVYFSQYISAVGGKVGPLKGDNVYHVVLKQSLFTNSWAFIEASVETEEEDALFSFGKELWREAGYEYGERWEEIKEKVEYDFALPEGRFYLNVSVPERKMTNTNQIKVIVYKKRGSYILMLIIAFISFLAIFVLYLIKRYMQLI